MRVLYHIDEEACWKITLSNISNMLEYGRRTATEFEIEVVANGEAAAVLKVENAKQLNMYSEIFNLYKHGVKFCVCQNSLNNMNILDDELCLFTTVVPSGVVEIAFKQAEGFSYIKP